MNRRRLLILIGCVLFAAPVLAKGADKLGSANVIDFLKAYPVSKIGSDYAAGNRLPEIPLEKWLRSVMGNTPLEWKSDRCSVYDSNIEGDGCVSYSVTVSTPKGHCPSVKLGFGVGNDGTVYLERESGSVNDFGAGNDVRDLAELKTIFNEVKAKAVFKRPSSFEIGRMRKKNEQVAARYAAGLDVRLFDPSLPSERFDKWLERISGELIQPPIWRLAGGYVWDQQDCRFTPLNVFVWGVTNEEKVFYVSMDLGPWEEEIKGTPKLHLAVQRDPHVRPLYDSVIGGIEDLFEFKNKIDAWKVAYLARKPTALAPTIPKPVVPVFKPTLPVVQNMTKLGYFFRTVSTGHCYGHQVSLWKHGERVFGTHYDLDGQCADSRAPTYIMREVKHDSKTGELEFWSYGKPGSKFVGKIDQDMVMGEFLGTYEKETLKLKRDKNAGPFLDSDKNVEVWCKVYAPNLRYVVQEEVKELCASLGVQ